MRNVYLYPFSKYAESCLPQYIMCWECEVKGIPKSPVIISTNETKTNKCFHN